MVLIGLPEEQAEPDAWALSPGGLLRNKFRVQAGRRVLRLPVGFSCAAKAEIHSLTLFFWWNLEKGIFGDANSCAFCFSMVQEEKEADMH